MDGRLGGLHREGFNSMEAFEQYNIRRYDWPMVTSMFSKSRELAHAFGTFVDTSHMSPTTAPVITCPFIFLLSLSFFLLNLRYTLDLL